METGISARPVSPCTSQKTEPSSIPIFKIENITIARPLLLKIFYWEFLGIERLNEVLSSQEHDLEHHLELPAGELNSNPLKIVFWLRNETNYEYVIRLKRIRNCECTPQETRVGFNQYRNLYHCLHRRLIHISQDYFVLRPNELLAMTVTLFYYILGNHVLSYALRISESRTVMLHFHVNIGPFDVTKSVLTSSLIPLDIKEHRRMSQPIWIQNSSEQNTKVLFAGKNHDFRLVNPKMVVPPQSVWPLIVQYRPSDFENNLNMCLRHCTKSSAKCYTKIPISCKGFLQEEIENNQVPILDHESADYLYVVFPNRLEFITEINEERTLMVAVHNYNEKCVEFKWQTYSINDYFNITFEPQKFTLKPKHSKLCVVQAKSFNNPLHFKRVPAVLEIHCIPDKPNQIARELISDIESIDDPEWAVTTYMSHVLLHIDMKVKFPELQRINIRPQPGAPIDSAITIFEKLFWEHLSRSDHMRNTSKISKNLSYKQVLNQQTKTKTKKKEPPSLMTKGNIFNILSFLTAEACRDLSKNYRFIPLEILENI